MIAPGFIPVGDGPTIRAYRDWLRERYSLALFNANANRRQAYRAMVGYTTPSAIAGTDELRFGCPASFHPAYPQPQPLG